MANQYALPPSDRRKKREQEAERANRPAPKSIKVPPVPDPVGLPSKMITEGGTTAFESLGLPTWLAEKVAEAYKTGIGYLPFVGKSVDVADELSKTPEQRLADLGSEAISPTDVDVKRPGDTTPRAAIIIGTGASPFPACSQTGRERISAVAGRPRMCGRSGASSTTARQAGVGDLRSQRPR